MELMWKIFVQKFWSVDIDHYQRGNELNPKRRGVVEDLFLRPYWNYEGDSRLRV